MRGGESLDSVLETLKADGASVLVSGDVPITVINEASGRLAGRDFGAPTPRHRVFGFLGRPINLVRDRIDESTRVDSRVYVVDGPSKDRMTSATVNSTPAERYRPNDVTVDDKCQSLASFLSGVEVGINTTVPASPAPSQLRVCIDSLAILDDTSTRKGIINCIQTLTKAHDGMAHFVMDQPYDETPVIDLHDVVDIIFEYDIDTGGARQRIRIPGRDIITDWWRFP